MCGRFVRERSIEYIANEFGAEIGEGCEMELSYNVAPTHKVAVILKDGVKQVVGVRWGLIPPWAGAPKVASKLINARAETVATKAAFRDAFRERRCLVIADGFYEWKKSGQMRLPVYVYLKSGRPFGFAGLWERWNSPEGEWVTTCTIITTEANDIMRPIHNRMPVILPREVEDQWLDPDTSDSVLLGLLKPYPPEAMETRQVSMLVNSTKIDSPECLRPADLPSMPTLFEL
jgi:putative SOS response-associated peptidase YedK